MSCTASPGSALPLDHVWHAAAAAGTIVAVSCGILVVLFLIQRNGTSKIGYAFSPIMLAFLLFNGGVGAYNIGKHDASVFKVKFDISEHDRHHDQQRGGTRSSVGRWLAAAYVEESSRLRLI